MPTFHFNKSKPITLGHSKSLDEARVAVAEQVELVKEGRSTARQSMAYLLKTFSVLRKDRRGVSSHALLPLVGPFVKETLG